MIISPSRLYATAKGIKKQAALISIRETSDCELNATNSSTKLIGICGKGDADVAGK